MYVWVEGVFPYGVGPASDCFTDERSRGIVESSLVQDEVRGQEHVMGEFVPLARESW